MAHSGDHNFSVPLGILAGKREYLNFDRWVQERIKAGGAAFVNMLISYIDENVLAAVREQ
jgi:CCR4-NOT transcription complex subunit 1